MVFFFFFFGPFPGVNLHKKYTLRDACVCVRVCVCVCVCVCLVTQSCPISCDPMDCSPPVSSVHGILCKNTGVGCHFLLQMIFLTQGSNPGLLLCRQILYHLNLQRSPQKCILIIYLKVVFTSFCQLKKCCLCLFSILLPFKHILSQYFQVSSLSPSSLIDFPLISKLFSQVPSNSPVESGRRVVSEVYILY